MSFWVVQLILKLVDLCRETMSVEQNDERAIIRDVMPITVRYDKTRLKTMDTIGNCQRPVFLLGLSQHVYNITNL